MILKPANSETKYFRKKISPEKKIIYSGNWNWKRHLLKVTIIIGPKAQGWITSLKKNIFFYQFSISKRPASLKKIIKKKLNFLAKSVLSIRFQESVRAHRNKLYFSELTNFIVNLIFFHCFFPPSSFFPSFLQLYILFWLNKKELLYIQSPKVNLLFA